MKIFEFLQSEEKKVIGWFETKEPQLIKAIKSAQTFTQSCLDWLKSEQGMNFEQFIASKIKGVTPIEQEVIKIATSLLQDMKAVKSKEAIRAIALRLGGEICAIIHGKKLSIDEYISEFQNIFVG